MPRSHKTPGRRARDVGRAQASRAKTGAVKALRGRVHTSKRSKAWRAPSALQRERRLPDLRRFEEQGRAGSGQRRSTGPRADAVAAPRKALARGPPGAMERRMRRQRGRSPGPSPGTESGR